MALGSESATAWPAAADFEELTTTAAPAADSDLATAAPIPLAEPVTIATLPCRLIRVSRRGRLVPGQLSCPYPHRQALDRGQAGLAGKQVTGGRLVDSTIAAVMLASLT